MRSCDVERLLLALLPALSLAVAGCDDGSGGGKKADGGAAKVDGKKADGGDAKADGRDAKAGSGDAKAEGGDTKADGGDAKADGSDTKTDGGDAKADGGDTKTDGGDTKTDGGDATIGGKGLGSRPDRRLPRCPSGKWCAPKKAALKIASKKKPRSLGCPPELAGSRDHEALQKSDPAYKGIWINTTAFSAKIDDAATEAKRAAGDANTCCYNWGESCPGGRPLLDDTSQPVVATLEPGTAWLGTNFEIDASPEELRRAGEQWLADAAAEHASVASFGRVALELMALGAPPDLLRDTHHAALDEIRHAQTCLAIAAACGVGAKQPGPLSACAPRAAELPRFAADTFIEGCVGETTAALVMERAAAGVAAGPLKQALEGIAKDEASHAALAWRSVAWAVERGGAPVLAELERTAERLRHTLSQPSEGETSLAVAGRLSARELDRARRDAWHGIIEPMLARLQRAENQ
ncbi:MAG: ferritin-like domain-containing protein [Myxococcota bacterium]